jgi:hypothetical protein
MKKIILFFIGTLIVACGKEIMKYDIDVSTPVVEGYLTTGASTLSVKVYSMESFDEDSVAYSKPIKNLELYINDRKLTETADGTYTLDALDGMLDEGKTCNLRFEYNNKTVTASTVMPSYPQNAQINNLDILLSSSGYWNMDSIPDVKVTWNNTDNAFYQVYIWSLDNSNGSMPGGRGFGRMMMQPFQGNSYQLTMRDMMSEGRYVCYLYKINKDYAELYERVSSSDLANPVSFITNGLGVFTGISADTISYRVSSETASE